MIERGISLSGVPDAAPMAYDAEDSLASDPPAHPQCRCTSELIETGSTLMGLPVVVSDEVPPGEVMVLDRFGGLHLPGSVPVRGGEKFVMSAETCEVLRRERMEGR